MKKVLILQIKNHTNGGIRFVNKLITDELTKLGYETRICSIRDEANGVVDEQNPKVKLDIINDVDEWEIVHKRDVLNSIKKFTFLKTLSQYVHDRKILTRDYKKLKEYINEYNPDIIIASHYEVFPGIPKEFLSRTINLHHTSYDMMKTFKNNKKELLKIKDKIQFVWLSKGSCESAINDGFRNSTFIYNPIRFKSSKKANVCKNKKLVTIARLGEEKRIELMIDLANKVLKKPEYKDWKLEIYGYGDLEKRIKEHIRKTKNKNIEFKGKTDSPKDVLLTSSIYLCTSKFEGFSLSIIEAYECGIPVIAFNFGESVYEAIDDQKTGYIINNDNEEEYIEKLANMMSNTDLLEKLSTNSKEKAKDFQIENLIKKWIKLFEKIDKE